MQPSASSPARGATRVAVFDLGTNTTRLLIADVLDRHVEELERCTNVTRLGEGLGASGQLGEAAMERVHEALGGYRELVEQFGVERRAALATSAVRDAENGDSFRRAVRERHGIDVRTISGEEEAQLTFRGATNARPEGGAPTLVLDIGGGSTEFVVGVPGHEHSFDVSTAVGAVRQTELYLASDPPTAEQVAQLAREVADLIDRALPQQIREQVVTGIAVAGTATSMAAIEQRLDPYDPGRIDGYRLKLPACERTLEMLAALPLAERRKVPGLHPDRAPTIIAGIVILIKAMRAFGLDAIETSEADILHGAALSCVGGK